MSWATPRAIEALVAVAQTLKASVRAEDLVARMGGDEFALLISSLTLRQAEFRLKTGDFGPGLGALPGSPTVVHAARSAAAPRSSPPATPPASLIHRADEALYQAKHLGKNRVVTKASPYLVDLMKRR